MFKVNNKNTRTTSLTSFWCFQCYFEHISYLFPSATIVDFEQVNFNWKGIGEKTKNSTALLSKIVWADFELSDYKILTPNNNHSLTELACTFNHNLAFLSNN